MKNKLLAEKIALSSAGVSGTLFKAEKQAERDGIEMGVLENGMPYLSEAGLARLCGVARSTLQGRFIVCARAHPSLRHHINRWAYIPAMNDGVLRPVG